MPRKHVIGHLKSYTQRMFPNTISAISFSQILIVNVRHNLNIFSRKIRHNQSISTAFRVTMWQHHVGQRWITLKYCSIDWYYNAGIAIELLDLQADLMEGKPDTRVLIEACCQLNSWSDLSSIVTAWQLGEICFCKQWTMHITSLHFRY